jgi:protease YdgD
MAVACAGAGVPEQSTVLPGMGGADPRVRVDPAQPPWTAVARLQIPGVSRCTAVVVAPRLAVTAAHCLYSRRAGHWMPAGSVHVLIGYAAGGFKAHLLAQRYRIAPGYQLSDPDGTRGADVALVSLAEPAADVMALAISSPPAGTAAGLAGYNQDRAEVLEVDAHCAVAGVLRDRHGGELLAHDCAATRGTSGGPLLVRDADGREVLAGVQVGARDTGVGGVAVPVETVRELLGE